MSESFAIKVKGDARRSAAREEEIAWECTVTNVSDATLTARTQIVAVTPETSRAWIRLEDETLRELTPNKETTVRVVARAPAGTEVGAHAFRILVNAQEDPESLVAESPPLELRVREGKPPRKFPLWIPIAAGAAILVAVVVLVIVLSSGDEGIRYKGIKADPDWVAVGPPVTLRFTLEGLKGDLLSADWAVAGAKKEDQHGETMRHEFPAVGRFVVTVTAKGTEGDPRTTTASIYILEKDLVGLTLEQAIAVITPSLAVTGDLHPPDAPSTHTVTRWESRRPNLIDLWLER